MLRIISLLSLLCLASAQLSANFRFEVVSEATRPPVNSVLKFTPLVNQTGLTYSWSTSNGLTSSQQTPSFTFTSQGFINVSLTVSNGSASTTLTQLIPIRGFPSVNIISPSVAFLANQEFRVNVTGTDSLSQPLVFPDDFEIEVFVNSTAGNIPLTKLGSGPVYRYPARPTSNATAATQFVFVRVKAVDVYQEGNRTLSRNLTTTRVVPPTIVTLNFDTRPQSGLDVIVANERFTAPARVLGWANSTVTINAPAQGQFNFLSWSDNGPQSHNILLPGGVTTRNYTATFQVGGQSLFTYQIRDSTPGFLPKTVDFTTSVLTVPTNYQWNFGDGTTSTLPNPTKQYTTKGIYNVTLTVTDPLSSTPRSQTQSIPIVGLPDITVTSPGITSFIGNATFVVDANARDSLNRTVPKENLTFSVEYFDGATRTALTPLSPYTYRFPARPRNSTSATSSRVFVAATIQDGFFQLTRTREIAPLLAQVEFTSQPVSGLELIVFDNERIATPFTVRTWPNGDFNVVAPNQGDYNFISWSNDKTQSHIVDIPSIPVTTRLTATYSNPLLDDWRDQRAKGSTAKKNTLSLLIDDYFTLRNDGGRARKLRLRGRGE